MTYDLFMGEHKYSIKEISSLRNMTVPTIEGHIVQCIYVGQELDFKRIELDKDTYDKIMEAVKQEGSDEKLKPIKERCPEYITYLQIKCAIAIYKTGLESRLT